MTANERAHVEQVKRLNCVICGAPGPSEAHEIEQGLWFTTIACCSDCHRGSVNGWHGQKRMWAIHKMDELKALNETLRAVL
jgi:hypothetical protein